MELIYDIKQGNLVTAAGAIIPVPPSIYFHQQIPLTLHVKKDGTNMDLSHISTWRAAIDKDDLSYTFVMCRTLNDGIDASRAVNGILLIALNTNTETFQKAVNRKIGGVDCLFELWGFETDGRQTFYLSFPMKACTVADPYGGVVPSAPVNGTIDVTQLQALMKKYLPVKLSACSSLGMTGTGNGFSWTDPDDVVLNGATLAQWIKTALVRKEGSTYPTSPTDGTILVTTSREAGNKNYYRDHTFTDETKVSGVTYSYKLFSQTETGMWNCLAGNEYTSGTGLSWYQVQQYVRAGRGAELFPVGTTFVVTHGDFVHTDGTGLYFRVVGHDQVPCADESLTHSMCLECTECIATLPFDAVELEYALTADTTYKSGKTYYSLSGTTYTAMVAGTDYNVGDTVPLATVYERNLYFYNKGPWTSGRARWADSNIRQWLNSSGNAGSWFTKQNIWDLCAGDLQNRDGFCKNIDQDFLAVVQPAVLPNRLSGAEDSQYINVTNKFFILAVSQMVTDSNYGAEGEKLQWYVNGNSIIKNLINGSAVQYYTRSIWATYNDPTDEQQISSTGTFLEFGGSRNNRGIAPACIIA